MIILALIIYGYKWGMLTSFGKMMVPWTLIGSKWIYASYMEIKVILEPIQYNYTLMTVCLTNLHHWSNFRTALTMTNTLAFLLKAAYMTRDIMATSMNSAYPTIENLLRRGQCSFHRATIFCMWTRRVPVKPAMHHEIGDVFKMPSLVFVFTQAWPTAMGSTRKWQLSKLWLRNFNLRITTRWRWCLILRATGAN